MSGHVRGHIDRGGTGSEVRRAAGLPRSEALGRMPLEAPSPAIYVAIQAVLLHNAGFRILFFSYQWLSWNQPGPNSIQWEWIQVALGLYCEGNCHGMGKAYVWLDILSLYTFGICANLSIDVLQGPIGSIPAGADDRSMDEFSRRAGPRSTLPFAAVGPALLPTSAVGPAILPVEESTAKVSEESIAKLRDLLYVRRARHAARHRPVALHWQVPQHFLRHLRVHLRGPEPLRRCHRPLPANNFDQGHYTIDREIADLVLDHIRKLPLPLDVSASANSA